jgi:hypothetical protein
MLRHRPPFVPIPRPPFGRIPERRRVTLIAGFLTGSCVVLAADSEEVISDYAKASTQKIRVTDCFGNWRIAIAGAGDGTYIDLFEQMLARRLFTIQQFEFEKITGIIRATLHEIHKKHIWPRHGDQRVSFQAIIALQGCGEKKGRGLFYTSDSAMLAVDGSLGFKTIGVGSYLADYIIKRSTPDYTTIYNMPPSQVMNLAAHVLAQVKSSDCGIQGVDGETNVLVMDGITGSMRWMMDKQEVKAAEEWLETYHRLQLPLMMAIANPHLPQNEFDRILETFRAQVAGLRLTETLATAEWERQMRIWAEQIKQRTAVPTKPSKPRKSKDQR